MNSKIGIFDSGIGGITVLRECLKINPNFEYIYYSDSKNIPYGNKTKEELNKIVNKIVEFLINERCLIIIIACNTASALCVENLREKYQNITFIAIEPAIKIASKLNNNSSLIMATKGTLDSDKFKKLYNQYKKENFFLLPCENLANMIENDYKKDFIITYLKKILTPFIGKVSSVILGCTHYPLIKEEIKSILNNKEFYDGSIGVARMLDKIIKEKNLIHSKDSKITFYDSSNDLKKEERFRFLLNEQLFEKNIDL